MVATSIPILDQPTWASRLLANFPAGWTGDGAKVQGGNLYSLFASIGYELNLVDLEVLYAFNTCRIATAIDVALDTVANDFFGADLARLPGENDTSLRQRIFANLFPPGATRAALDKVITKLVGVHPRLLEPWAPADCGAWDMSGMSYYDVDTPQNPFRWSDSALRYQGFCESALPTYANQGNNPVWCYDAGAAWDAPTSAWMDAQNTWFIGIKQLDALISRTKAEGTTVWRKYATQVLSNQWLGGTVQLTAGATSKLVTVYPPFAGLYIVVAQASWNTEIEFLIVDNANFRLIPSTPCPPGGGSIDWVAAPITFSGAGLLPIATGVYSQPFARPAGHAADQVFALTNWETNIWLAASSPTQVTVGFSTAAGQQASLRYIFIAAPNSGNVLVPTGSTVITIATPVGSPNFQALVMPSWNTQVTVTRTPTSIIASFNVPAPAGSFLNWGIHYS